MRRRRRSKSWRSRCGGLAWAGMHPVRGPDGQGASSHTFASQHVVCLPRSPYPTVVARGSSAVIEGVWVIEAELPALPLLHLLPPCSAPPQMAVLNDTAAEDLGDQDALEAELEKELAAEEAVEGEDAAGPTPQRKKVRPAATAAPAAAAVAAWGAGLACSWPLLVCQAAGIHGRGSKVQATLCRHLPPPAATAAHPAAAPLLPAEERRHAHAGRRTKDDAADARRGADGRTGRGHGGRSGRRHSAARRLWRPSAQGWGAWHQAHPAGGLL